MCFSWGNIVRHGGEGVLPNLWPLSPASRVCVPVKLNKNCIFLYKLNKLKHIHVMISLNHVEAPFLTSQIINNHKHIINYHNFFHSKCIKKQSKIYFWYKIYQYSFKIKAKIMGSETYNAKSKYVNFFLLRLLGRGGSWAIIWMGLII